ncbi:DinB family protein [Actinoplanes sp. KI2]|uniref:DinB family protein n=1 Tax=Actinoplanes sp. KI2 TaxID=2983315 RepID=UPI0021D5994E|nr:DinB family protein [Actinoplanes sp. KI2]MCU7727683.1 DinB family protein [Actinoplanes sp. KI2]
MVDYGALLVSQLEFYWDAHLRPRLDGLTDEEYLWEPVPDCWTVRPDGRGGFAYDGYQQHPQPAPFTTLAWRIVHVATAMSIRTSTFFTDSGDADMFDLRHWPASIPGNAADGIAFLQTCYRDWHDHIAALSPAELERPLGPKGGFFAKEPMAALIVHINREVMHHGGEIGVLRDLYRHRHRQAA